MEMQVSGRNEVNYVQLDWLEFFVEVSETKIQGFECKVFEGGTKNYKQRIEYVLDGKVVATLVWLPRSKVIRSASGSDQVGNLRIHNHVLYSGRCKEVTDSIMNGTNIMFLSVTRVDICSDFNAFANRRHPENLIKDFLRGSIRRKKARGMKDIILNIAKDNNSMAERVEETLYFGNSKSGISTKLYNKTKELADKTEKVYIKELWENCDTIDTEKDVWRLEVSVKAKEFRELATGRVLRLDNSNVFCLETQTKLYLSILAHNFAFVQYDSKKTRLDRMKTIQLFSGVFKAFQKHNKLDDRANTKRDRNALKYNAELARNAKDSYYRSVEEYQRAIADQEADVLRRLAIKRDLDNYRELYKEVQKVTRQIIETKGVPIKWAENKGYLLRDLEKLDIKWQKPSIYPKF